jgi:hypothetical protein
MEIVNAHIAMKLNVVATNLKHKTKVNNPLQQIKPNPSRMFVIKDLICGKVVGYQKSLGLIFFFFIPCFSLWVYATLCSKNNPHFLYKSRCS